MAAQIGMVSFNGDMNTGLTLRTIACQGRHCLGARRRDAAV
jgi:anthranilate/para-aminobenzoate synthase component I